MRGVTFSSPCIRLSVPEFQLTRLMRGVTCRYVQRILLFWISTHTPHARRDSFKKGFSLRALQFQLTRLMRGVTCRYVQRILLFWISTHTPHARRDSLYAFSYASGIVISTHTPHARRDYTVVVNFLELFVFQLTRLMRGVTEFLQPPRTLTYHFNSHASCEA